ncbi:hypothetical protein [Janthinobacterium sp. 17J80-10]|uniref:hypothetical protein n=1 Tax=Janthinobacterium sp. 17J80-10 TaxID=2497863 RepID=UPI0010053255|nr:hypothetical protein [Janthinobacterium sp. 17J80-10]QAU33131.1 hypothetical protein EKL02_02465 [Janthinobacterium sp. 17J80-10]
MKSETLTLASPLNEAGALQAAQLLNSMSGVSKVAITTAAGAIDVAFDENLTSVQELRTVLQKAGLRVKPLAHGEAGMCCGSCGG